MTFRLILLFLIFSLKGFTQSEPGVKVFWNNLKPLCGKAYAGTVIEAPENDDFRGKKLIMHVRSCSESMIFIPFLVGDNRSRTWVLTLKDNRVQLKHDHRHEDGSPDAVTMYGGTTSNSSLSNILVFPADQETADLIPAAATNVWWITLDDTSFTYNLRRLGTDRYFSIRFDLTKPVETPPAPWGWTD